MKKRLLIVIALALVFTLALTLAACGGSTEQNPDSGAPSTPDGGQSPETPDGGQTPETPDEGDEGETPTPPVNYTVTFETNGGSTVKSVTVDEGDAVASAPETTLDPTTPSSHSPTLPRAAQPSTPNGAKSSPPPTSTTKFSAKITPL